MIKKTYRWKEVTEDGLLKEPKEFSKSYNTDCLNNVDGYDTEEQAYKKLEYVYKFFQHTIPPSLTLVPMFEVVDDDKIDGK